ncbi:CIS tube protein [Streptomyces sp. NPDC002536]
MPQEQMIKATLEVYAPPIGGQEGPGRRMGDPVKFQFNPAELSLVKETSWARHSSRLAPNASAPEFLGGRPGVLTMTVVLDKSKPDDASVDARVGTLLKCCRPEENSLRNNQASPPWVRFSWGHCETARFYAVMRRLAVRFTRFSSDGHPLRAVCELTLEEIGE